jgi:hypothetical protein
MQATFDDKQACENALKEYLAYPPPAAVWWERRLFCAPQPTIPASSIRRLAGFRLLRGATHGLNRRRRSSARLMRPRWPLA